MADRRSKYTISARDKMSSIGGDTVRNFNDNFVTEFLKYANEYNAHPLPKIISHVDLRAPSTLSSISEKIEDDGSPIFHLTYQNKKLTSPTKIESKDKLPDCNINAFGVMQIAEMLRNIGCVRDLNLDMNPNVQENYHLLCTSRGSLKYLSLRLCKITDTGVEKIARELQYRDPPNNPKLLILNLANNHVTKDGAVHLGQMLRTNR
ncbi:hypothetical protein WN48_01077 [Eufriesea mexicana]|nr:hypothetical protein WN48_01077 [Eufriesea mexicana]